MVNKLDWQTITSEFEFYWVLHIFGRATTKQSVTVWGLNKSITNIPVE